MSCSASNPSVCEGLWCNISDATLGSGVCAPCPAGWKGVGGSCAPCPAGSSCDTDGNVMCEGSCPGGMYPVCDPASGYVECSLCSAPVPAHAVGRRGAVLDRPDLCYAYSDCVVGYSPVLRRGNTFFDTVETCVPCAAYSNGSVQFITRGLSMGNSRGCMYTPSVAGQVVSYNVMGTWGNKSDTCPVGYTSVPGRAGASADCVPCAALPDHSIQTDVWVYGCEVRCKGIDDVQVGGRTQTYTRVGQLCVPAAPAACPFGFASVHTDDGLVCSPALLPWNMGGFYTMYDDGASSATSVTTEVHPLGHANLVAFESGTGGRVTVSSVAGGYVPYLLSDGPSYSYVYATRVSGTSEAHALRRVPRVTGVDADVGARWSSTSPTADNEWPLPGRACGSAVGVDLAGRERVYMSLCGSPSVVFLEANQSGTVDPAARVDVYPALSLLTGSVVETGDEDGLRDQARFGTTLSVAVAPVPSVWGPYRVFVLDQDTCRLVEVAVGTPGAFVNHAQTIRRGCDDIQAPRLLTSVMGGRFLLFLADGGLYQVDTYGYSVRQAMPVDVLPSGVMWLGVADESDSVTEGSTLRVWTTGTRVDLRRDQVPCDDGYSSTLGSGACSVCATGYYSSPSRGVLTCTACNRSLSCPTGKFAIPCTAGADAMCVGCESYSGIDILPDQLYSWVGGASTCTLVYVSPCPDGYWGSNQCTKCPPNTYTPNPGRAKLLEHCVCEHCGYRVGVDECVVPSPYAANRSQAYANSTCLSWEVEDVYLTNTEWADWNGCPPVGTSPCARVCALDAESCTECGASGRYLEQYFPRQCRECPDGKWGADGLKCSPCPILRVSGVNHTFCMCGYGTVFRAPDSCVCPSGHEVASVAEGCTPCLSGFYNPFELTVAASFIMGNAALSLCTRCPPGSEAIPGGSSACTPCADGMYNAGNLDRCATCPQAGWYASDASTALSCIACDDACGPGTRAVPCPLHPQVPGKVRCVACTPPPEMYPLLGEDMWEWTVGDGSRECMWKCKDDGGHYVDDDMRCAACTSAEELSCEAGTAPAPCSRFRDAHCAACVNETMPAQGAEWDPVTPCHWRCVQGYEVSVKVYSGWTERACVQKVEGNWDWWMPS